MAAPPLTRPAPPFLASPVRQRALEFLMDASFRLAVTPVVKYTALSLFADRFLPTLPRELSRFGELLCFGTCMDIMDLLYETEETSSFYNHPHLLAASILIAAYVLTVKKQQWEFPLLPWGNYDDITGRKCVERLNLPCYNEVCDIIRRRTYCRTRQKNP